MIVNDLFEPRSQRIHISIPLDLRRVHQQFLAPDQSGLVTQFHDVLEESPEGVEAEAVTDARETGMIGKRLIEVIAEIPAMGKVQGCEREELTFGADSLEEHDELELEEDDRVDGGTTNRGIEVGDPVPDEREIKRTLKMAIEVIDGNERFKGDGDRAVELAALTGAEHGGEAFLWRE